MIYTQYWCTGAATTKQKLSPCALTITWCHMQQTMICHSKQAMTFFLFHLWQFGQPDSSRIHDINTPPSVCLMKPWNPSLVYIIACTWPSHGFKAWTIADTIKGSDLQGLSWTGEVAAKRWISTTLWSKLGMLYETAASQAQKHSLHLS